MTITIYIPYGLIAIFMSFFCAYYTNEKRRIRREARRERLAEMQQEMLEAIRQRDGKEPGAQGDDTASILKGTGCDQQMPTTAAPY